MVYFTFTINGRRRLLKSDLAKRIVLGTLYNAMRKFGVRCVGFVIMLNHVHIIVHGPSKTVLRKFMKSWKRKSSIEIRQTIRSGRIRYPLKFLKNRKTWIHRSFPFTIRTRKKLEEKLNYMHMNPVRAGLVERTIDWPWSSAGYYELGKDVGVPITWVELD